MTKKQMCWKCHEELQPAGRYGMCCMNMRCTVIYVKDQRPKTKQTKKARKNTSSEDNRHAFPRS